MGKYKLTILCMTYNQANFICRCLDGFLSQKTDFPFQVIVHDDASNDGTADIIREYAEKYPDIIKPILQKENQWSRGVNIWKTYMWPKIDGEYVALCEGDDYWTDPYKLQKQVDFLDSHQDYSICFHPVSVKWEDNSAPDSVFPTAKYRFNKHTLSLSDLLQHNFIQTNSVVYRWRGDCIKIFPDCVLPGDYYLHLLHAQVGKIGFIPDVMAVYRRNSGGVWSGAHTTDNWYIYNTMPLLKFYKSASAQFNHDYSAEMISVASGGVCAFLRASLMNQINAVRDMYPEIWKSVTERINAQDIYYLQKSAKKYKTLFNTMLILFVILVIVCALESIFLY